MSKTDYDNRREGVEQEAKAYEGAPPALARALTNGKADKIDPRTARALSETMMRDVERGHVRPTRELAEEANARARRR